MKRPSFLVLAVGISSPFGCLSWVYPIARLSSNVVVGMTHGSKPSSSTELPPVFPMSIRKALVDNAKQLDDNLAKGESTGTYSPAGWSNRLGTVLTPASIPGVYTGDRPFFWNRIDVGCRMTVIQLSGGNLWVHSPVGIDPPLKEALAKLGTVKYVVSPNFEHVKFAPQWHQHYPEAQMWGCPGLAEKMPDIAWTGEIPIGFRPSSWTGAPSTDALGWDTEEIQALHVDTETNPITGKPFFNEVIYYHKPSKTLITTDLYWNYPQTDGTPNSQLSDSPVYDWELAPRVESVPIGSQFWKFAMDKIYPPVYGSLLLRDKAKYEQIAKFLAYDLKVETVIPAHGDIIRGKSVIQKVLRSHFHV